MMPNPWFRLEDAYRFARESGLESEVRDIKAMIVHSAIPQPAVVRKGRLVGLFEEHKIMSDFVSQYWPGRPTEAGQKRYEKYVSKRMLNEALLNGDDEDAIEEQSQLDGRVSFVWEAQLRDFIAQNLPQISVGGRRLTLYADGPGKSGVEYPTDVGPIDILAMDDAKNFVVFELKLERGPDRALGQLARYMGWVKTNLAGMREVYGVIVAKSINDKLRYAASVIPNVELLEYEVQFHLRNVHLKDSLTKA